MTQYRHPRPRRAPDDRVGPADELWVVDPRVARGKQRFSASPRVAGSAVFIPGAILLFIILACFLGPILFSAPNPNIGDLTKPICRSSRQAIFSARTGTAMTRFRGCSTVASVDRRRHRCDRNRAGYRIDPRNDGRILRGLVEATVMRVLDTLLSFPSLILALAIADFLGPSEFHTILAVSFYGIVVYARLARSQTIRVRNRDFVVAARSSGVRPRKIIFGHILPNVMPPLLAYAMITVGVAMLVEAALSYLGLGIRPPQPSWGNMIFAGVATMTSDPALVLIPCLFLLVTVMSLNLTADALRRRLAFDR